MTIMNQELIVLAVFNVIGWCLARPSLSKFPNKFQKQRREVTLFLIFTGLQSQKSIMAHSEPRSTYPPNESL